MVLWTRGAGDWNKLRCSAAGIGSVIFGKDLICDAKARSSSEASVDSTRFLVIIPNVVSFLPIPTHGLAALARVGSQVEIPLKCSVLTAVHQGFNVLSLSGGDWSVVAAVLVSVLFQS